MKRIILYYYSLPFNYVIALSVSYVIVWTILSLRMKSNRTLYILNAYGFCISVCLIIYLTIVSRDVSNDYNIILIPLNFLIEAKEEPEVYRSTLMNVCLFVPSGATFSYLFSKKIKHRLFFTFCMAILCSLTIELVQFVFRLGRCEVDDVIMNSLGALIGSVSYLLYDNMKGKQEQIHKILNKI